MAWSGRPKITSQLTKVDWLVEAAALAGSILGLAAIAYGGLTLPGIVPTHIGPSGIDSYGSKWLLLSAFLVAICAFYGVLTVAGCACTGSTTW